MAVPTVIRRFVRHERQSDGMPFANTTAGFAIVLALTLALCVFAAWVLQKAYVVRRAILRTTKCNACRKSRRFV